MKKLQVFYFSIGWDASPLQGYPQHSSSNNIHFIYNNSGEDGQVYWSLRFRTVRTLLELLTLPDFIRRGPGYNRCIMGLTTQDPYIQKEHTELYKILKFRVNWAIIEQDTAIQKR